VIVVDIPDEEIPVEIDPGVPDEDIEEVEWATPSRTT
jgi:hypothetical protein